MKEQNKQIRYKDRMERQNKGKNGWTRGMARRDCPLSMDRWNRSIYFCPNVSFHGCIGMGVWDRVLFRVVISTSIHSWK
jgi:hypothetical protein